MVPPPPPRYPPPSPVSKLSLFLSLPVFRQSSLLTREREWGEGGGQRTESYDGGERAWPSINHSILPALACTQGKLLVSQYKEYIT
jgi:hypothetical protein